MLLVYHQKGCAPKLRDSLIQDQSTEFVVTKVVRTRDLEDSVFELQVTECEYDIVYFKTKEQETNDLDT